MKQQFVNFSLIIRGENSWLFTREYMRKLLQDLRFMRRQNDVSEWLHYFKYDKRNMSECSNIDVVEHEELHFHTRCDLQALIVLLERTLRENDVALFTIVVGENRL